jgi:hypothetical protein
VKDVDRDPVELAVEAAHKLIVAYYAMDNPAGGSLHIVTDDFNIEDRSIRHCIEEAELEADPAEAELVEAIGELLLVLPLEHRARAVSPWLCARCGHSVILHRPFETGSLTAAYRGECMLEECDCTHGDPELD